MDYFVALHVVLAMNKGIGIKILRLFLNIMPCLKNKGPAFGCSRIGEFLGDKHSSRYMRVELCMAEAMSVRWGRLRLAIAI